jgi:hypothetical protein
MVLSNFNAFLAPRSGGIESALPPPTELGMRATSSGETAHSLVKTVLVTIASLVVLLLPHPARGEGAWLLSLYGGHFGGSGNGDMAELQFRDTYFTGLGLQWEFAESDPHVRWELEGQALKHFGQQDNGEFALTINVRWITFPWDAYLDTSLAFGSGLSYATDVPALEARENPNTGSTRLLHYLLVDVAFAVPGAPRWSVVTRIHHRSGIWGFFDGVGRASNFFVVGLRYRF